MRTVVVGVLVSALYVSCSDDPEPPSEGTGGMDGEHDGGARTDGMAQGSAGTPTGPAAGGSGDGLGGSGRAAGGDGGTSPPLGGSGGAGLAGESQEAAGGAGRGSNEVSGGASGAPGGTAGSPALPPTPLNGCSEFVDARPSPDHRVIPWDYSLGHDPRRCLLVQVGQAVTWQGPFATHPIQRAGGTMPSPILGDTLSDDTSYQVAFYALGTYGYECGLHASMRGAIRVVE